MVNIRITGGKELVGGLKGMAQAIPVQSSRMLDMAAREAQLKMKQEAPEATGELRGGITIAVPLKNIRVIGNYARYGYWKQTRAYKPQRMPPVSKIMRWAQVKGMDSKAAFLIARKIAKTGYPANPFVARTFHWVQAQIGRQILPFGQGITARFSRGG